MARLGTNRHDGGDRCNGSDGSRYVSDRFAPFAAEQTAVSKPAVFEQVPGWLYLCRYECWSVSRRTVYLRWSATWDLESRNTLVHPSVYFLLHDLLQRFCLGRIDLEKPHHLRCYYRFVLGYLFYHRSGSRVCRRILERPSDDPIDRRGRRCADHREPTRSIALLERQFEYLASRIRGSQWSARARASDRHQGRFALHGTIEVHSLWTRWQ